MIKVKLVKPDPNYSIGKNNPVVGSKYECEGTLTRIGETKNPEYIQSHSLYDMETIINLVENNTCKNHLNLNLIQVIWDNKTVNSYKSGELVIINNKTPKCKSIW